MKKIEARIGSTILDAIQEGIALARDWNDTVGFDFNGVDVVVAKDSSPALIRRDWERGLRGYLGDNPTVGPYPFLELSVEQIASDAAIESVNEKRRQEIKAEYDKQEAAATAALQSALRAAGPIELLNEELWGNFKANNQDLYGGRVVKYADEWARLMQVQIDSGKTVAECAEELSRLADDDGITGFMYGCAVQVLAKCWKHGEALRRWHNKETQIGTEGDKANETGGVLNPALISF